MINNDYKDFVITTCEALRVLIDQAIIDKKKSIGTDMECYEEGNLHAFYSIVELIMENSKEHNLSLTELSMEGLSEEDLLS